jgi:hypothetical protein
MRGVSVLTALNLLKDQLKKAREIFQGTTADIALDHVHIDPGGKAFPIGTTYAHVVFSEDEIVNGMIRGTTPLYKGTWKDKTGVAQPMPAMDEHWSENNALWSKTARVDLPKLQEYAAAVFAQTDEYVQWLSDAELERVVDLGAWGKQTVAEMLSSMVIGHIYSLTGEISALKGVQGAKGYPF